MVAFRVAALRVEVGALPVTLWVSVTDKTVTMGQATPTAWPGAQDSMQKAHVLPGGHAGTQHGAPCEVTRPLLLDWKSVMRVFFESSSYFTLFSIAEHKM